MHFKQFLQHRARAMKQNFKPRSFRQFTKFVKTNNLGAKHVGTTHYS